MGMKKVFRYTQFLSNIAIVAIAIFLGMIAFKDVVGPPKIPATIAPSISPEAAAARINPVGQKVPLEGVNWEKNKKTLVMYVSSKCRYCTESGPFYQRLIDEKAAKDVKFVAVMPQTVEEGREYLTKLGVKVNDVYQTPLQAIGVKSTPTLLLVNESGVVTDSWVGKLQPEREQDVFSKLTL